MTRKILLSIDGGGIRGIIPICALIELEKQLGKPARDVFSFVAGTSTGAIISVGLARGISAQQALEIYQSLGTQVFRKDWLGFITSLGSFKYRTTPLANVLRQYVGDVTLNELTMDVMIPATRVRDGRAFYFVRDNAGNSQTTGNVKLLDCVTASAAAPTYFEPWDVPGFGKCVDGGVGIAGNPVYQQCVEAFEYTNGDYTPAETTVVSLGTGYYAAEQSPANILAWGLWVLGELLHDPAEQQTQLVQRHYESQGTRLVRLNPPLPRDIGLDDLGTVKDLIEIGTAAAKQLDWNALLFGTPDATDASGKTKDVLQSARLPRNLP